MMIDGDNNQKVIVFLLPVPLGILQPTPVKSYHVFQSSSCPPLINIPCFCVCLLHEACGVLWLTGLTGVW